MFECLLNGLASILSPLVLSIMLPWSGHLQEQKVFLFSCTNLQGKQTHPCRSWSRFISMHFATGIVIRDIHAYLICLSLISISDNWI